MTWSRRALLLLFCLAFGIRLVYAFAAGSMKDDGCGEVERAALTIASSGALANIYTDTSGPSAHPAPLYPLLLGGLFHLAGSDEASRLLVQRTLGALLTALSLCLVPWVARRTGLASTAGWVAAFALALAPFNLYTETSGRFEQPAAALGLLGLVGAFAALQADRWQSAWRIALVGICLGAAALLSPVLLLVGMLMIVGELLAGAGYRRRVIGGALAMGALTAALVAPWTYRNYQELGGFVPIRSNGGLELFLGNRDGASGRTYDPGDNGPSSIWGQHPSTSPREKGRLVEMGELAYMRERGRQGRAWILEHPAQFVFLCGRRLEYFWFPPADMWGAGLANEAKSYACLALSLAMCAGLVLLFWQRHSCRWLLAAALLGGSLPYILTHVDLRYRYPVFALSTLIACDVAWRALLPQVRGVATLTAVRWHSRAAA